METRSTTPDDDDDNRFADNDKMSGMKSGSTTFKTDVTDAGHKKGTLPGQDASGFEEISHRSALGYIFCNRPFVTVLQIENYLVSFGESFESGHIDR
jgi:hypothetical protein